MVSGAIPANDREVAKPLDRLKQRSARQRWRELRGEWVPAPDVNPQTLPDVLPKPEVAPFSAPMGNQATPIPTESPPVVSGFTTEEPWIVAPVPIPVEASPEVESQAFANSGAKPPTTPNEPLPPEGSFGDVVLAPRVTTPREHESITLPHWPFADDLDLVEQPVLDQTSNPASQSPTDIPAAALPSPQHPGTSQPPASPFAIQVAEDPAADAPVPNESVEPLTPETPVSPSSETVNSQPHSQSDPAPQFKSIQDIQPFYDYVLGGRDPNKQQKPPLVEFELVQQGSLDRNGMTIPVYWQASNVSHNPLYFEDSGLERSGHSFSDVVQPFVSVGKFGVQVAALPYTIALDPVWQRDTPLGHYRPGECAPKRHLALPINGRAAVTAAATYTGIIYLIP